MAPSWAKKAGLDGLIREEVDRQTRQASPPQFGGLPPASSSAPASSSVYDLSARDLELARGFAVQKEVLQRDLADAKAQLQGRERDDISSSSPLPRQRPSQREASPAHPREASPATEWESEASPWQSEASPARGGGTRRAASPTPPPRPVEPIQPKDWPPLDIKLAAYGKKTERGVCEEVWQGWELQPIR